jgi:predicted tellurium resistance membrane protein TerC
MELLSIENLLALVTLTALEIVLGIDNIVFIAILTGKLPKEKQPNARRLGLFFAMITRIMLLLTLSYIMHLTRPFFEVLSHPITGRDLVLIVGGVFLLAKSTHEIHDKLEESSDTEDIPKARAHSVLSAVLQIMVLDIVFSLDSVITAVGMAQQVSIMIAAIVVAVGVMMTFAGKISHFIEKHPTMKILALSFLLLIGVMLIAEGFGRHIEKGYVYFAMAFSFVVEMLNLKAHKGRKTTEVKH